MFPSPLLEAVSGTTEVQGHITLQLHVPVQQGHSWSTSPKLGKPRGRDANTYFGHHLQCVRWGQQNCSNPRQEISPGWRKIPTEEELSQGTWSLWWQTAARTALWHLWMSAFALSHTSSHWLPKGCKRTRDCVESRVEALFSSSLSC